MSPPASRGRNEGMGFPRANRFVRRILAPTFSSQVPLLSYISSMAFTKLGLSPAVVQGVKAMGYVEPTPIQLRAIPLMLAGHDVIGSAQTGTGKTAAFALPIL